MSGSVHLKNSSLITPSELTPYHILKLSALDSHLFLRFPFEFLLVYEPRHRALLDRARIRDSVKAALGRALIPYYPLAGRVRNRSDGSGLEVDCQAQGVLSTEATSDSTLLEFEGGPKHKEQWRNFLSFVERDVLKGAPPVVVQLTWLLDGGSTLAIGFSHCLCDGIGAGEFLNAFCDLATGKEGVNELKPKPTWSRHLFDPTAFSLALVNINRQNHPEYVPVPDICGFTSHFAPDKLTPTSTTFNGHQLNELKKLTKSNCTSFEVLAAHVWRSWARMLNLPSDQVTKLVFTMNIRERVKPRVPSGYYGNAFVMGCAEARVGELIQKGPANAAELVKRAKERVGDEYVREVVELVSRGGNVSRVGVLIITQWSRLGLNNVDFGIGRPNRVATVRPDIDCILLPDCNEADAVTVGMCVPSTALEQFKYLMKNIGA